MEARHRSWEKRLRVRLRLNEGEMSVFGSERSFDMPIGRNWATGEQLGGYYIDFRNKCESPEWPPYWLGVRPEFFVASMQWGLGALERFLGGEGEAWLEGARGAADYLLEHQHDGGPQDGGWEHLVSMPHSYRIDPPWLSAIVQGEGASLLVRLYIQTGDKRYAEAARRALKPMRIPVSEGGTLTNVDGAPMVEEYPTDVPSAVLNGAIFALWGFHDIGHGLGDAEASATFETLVDALVSNLRRFDTGYWSRYDLYPHPISNVASPAYHALHIKQLEVLNRLAPRPELEAAAHRFEAYRNSRLRRAHALLHKIAFRLLVPRNPLLAHRLPWNRSARSKRRPRRADVLVLSYHAVSPDWSAPLSVTPERLSDQLEHLASKGYRGVTFGEAVHGEGGGKVVAITFDDGYRSVPKLAGPILERFNMSGTVFVPTDFIDSKEPMSWPGIDDWIGGPHEQELVPMSWQEARSLAEAGWEIGSHTKSHPRLTQISDPELEEELNESRHACEQTLDQPCRSIAFPYGDYDATVVAATASAGYSAAATLPGGNPDPSPLSWPRIGIYHHDGPLSFRLKVSPRVRWLRRSRLWAYLIRPIRRLAGRNVE